MQAYRVTKANFTQSVSTVTITKRWSLEFTSSGLEDPDCDFVFMHPNQSTATYKDVDYYIGFLNSNRMSLYREEHNTVTVESIMSTAMRLWRT